MNPFGHLDLRVPSQEAASPFYARLLPALGFERTFHGGPWMAWATADPLPGTAYIAVTEEATNRPNSNRVAFWAPDRASVDRLAGVVREAGGQHVEGPEVMPYGPDYYAVYFDDPAGNRFEIYCRQGQ